MHFVKKNGLKITRSYKNICHMDARKILICAVIGDLEASLEQSPDLSFLINVTVIDVRHGGYYCQRSGQIKLEGVFIINFLISSSQIPMGILLSYTLRPPSLKIMGTMQVCCIKSTLLVKKFTTHKSYQTLCFRMKRKRMGVGPWNSTRHIQVQDHVLE
jgi:hypothetical protein